MAVWIIPLFGNITTPPCCCCNDIGFALLVGINEGTGAPAAAVVVVVIFFGDDSFYYE